MGVVIEGVETEGQRVLLRLAGISEMQGYLFAKPMSREGIDRLVKDAQLLVQPARLLAKRVRGPLRAAVRG
jgi:EAL domain-containing protein (putative c-di-GMP-specific phosphodiesterase class I)